MPALPGFVPPATHRATVHAAQEACGLVWVRLEGEGGELPAFPAEHDARLRKLDCGPYEVWADYQ